MHACMLRDGFCALERSVVNEVGRPVFFFVAVSQARTPAGGGGLPAADTIFRGLNNRIGKWRGNPPTARSSIKFPDADDFFCICFAGVGR